MRTPSLFLISALVTATLTYHPASAQNAKTTIVAANQKFMDAFAQGATTMSTLYARDAVLYPPNSDVVSGNEAIGTVWKSVNDAGIKRVNLETLEAEPAGDRILETGRYTLYGADGSSLDSGKYLVVWKKEGNDWKLFRDIWNTSKAAK